MVKRPGGVAQLPQGDETGQELQVGAVAQVGQLVVAGAAVALMSVAACGKPAEKAEQIKFGIVDLDMITKDSKGWHLYDVSKDSDLDGKANRAERLLLDSDVVATLTIAGGTRFAASWDDTPMG